MSFKNEPSLNEIPVSQENAEKKSFLRNLLFVTVIVFGFVYYGMWNYKKVFDTFDYIEVPAVVLTKGVDSYVGSKGKVHYIPEIYYEYEYKGKKYTGKKYRPIFETLHKERANEVIGSYSKGDKINVYVDPNDKSNVYIIKGFVPEYLLSPVVFISGFFGWLILVYMYFSGNYIAIKNEDTKSNISFLFARPTPFGFGLLVLTIGSFIIGLIIMWTEAIYTWDMVHKVLLAYFGLFAMGFIYRLLNKKPFRKYEVMIAEATDPNWKIPKTNYKNIAFITLVSILLLSFVALVFVK